MRTSILLAAVLLAASAATAAPDAGSRLERIQANHSLRVCIWPDYYGITYRNPKTM